MVDHLFGTFTHGEKYARQIDINDGTELIEGHF